MSAQRPSVRYGLPYKWWSAVEFWRGVVSLVNYVALVAFLTVVVLAWWGLL